ncbi:MAG: methionyl-tRNA formyltransferase [Corallococcus sp.]|nr:methionyl-tRNA formyltransferase [Corallococcus sp.]
MRVVFLGTPDFGVPAIESIRLSKHKIIATVCQPDKKGSRNKTEMCAVKRYSAEHGIPCFQFDKISRDGVETLKQLNPDIMVTAAYGQILSDEIIAIAKQGIINIHGSLLPKLRGAAPIQYAVLTGEKVTGITILNTVRKVDAGEIILQESLTVGDDETSGQLFERMAQLGAKLIVEALDAIESGRAVYTPQDESKATFSSKITPEKEIIDWNADANTIRNLIRALNPNPVAWTTINGKRLKVFEARLSDIDYGSHVCGKVVFVGKKYFSVSCGSGVLDILRVQEEGGKCMDSASFINGRKVACGQVLGE